MENVIIIASGPSLCQEDIRLARRSGWDLITVNSSWQLLPDCHAIYAGDYAWWARYHRHIHSAAERWTCSLRASLKFGLKYHSPPAPYGWNSGLRAIQLALTSGARNIALLGFDGDISAGSHWHGDHTGLNNPNSRHIAAWHKQFAWLAETVSDSRIMNCSRETRLSCFPRRTLRQVILPVTNNSKDRK